LSCNLVAMFERLKTIGFISTILVGK